MCLNLETNKQAEEVEIEVCVCVRYAKNGISYVLQTRDGHPTHSLQSIVLCCVMLMTNTNHNTLSY